MVSGIGVTGSLSDLIKIALPRFSSLAGWSKLGGLEEICKNLEDFREEKNEDLYSFLQCIYY